MKISKQNGQIWFKKYWIVLYLVVSELVLAACIDLPNNSTPEIFSIESSSPVVLEQTTNSPQPDSTAVQLIYDFIRAGNSTHRGNYDILREYLTTDAAASWSPEQNISIYSSASSISYRTLSQNEDNTSISISITTVANLSNLGVYLEYTQGQPETFTFDLIQNEDNQWRISSLPQGIIMYQSAFINNFALQSLYFPAVDNLVLIEELRFYSNSNLVSKIINGLLAGPNQNLRSSVINPYQGQTISLAPTGISQNDEVVTVSLSVDGVIEDSKRSIIASQIQQTLLDLDGITEVQVYLNDVLIEEAYQYQSYASTYLLAVDNNSEHIVRSSIDDISTTRIPIYWTKESLIDLAISPDNISSSGISTNILCAWAETDYIYYVVDCLNYSPNLELLDNPDYALESGYLHRISYDTSHLTSISVDRWHRIWISNTDSIDILDPEFKEIITVANNNLKASYPNLEKSQELDRFEIRNLSLSSDGSKIALTLSGEVQGSSTVSLYFAYTTNLINGDTTIFSISIDAEEIIDFTWQDGNSISILAKRTQATSAKVYQADIGAMTTTTYNTTPGTGENIISLSGYLLLETLEIDEETNLIESSVYRNSSISWVLVDNSLHLLRS